MYLVFTRKLESTKLHRFSYLRALVNSYISVYTYTHYTLQNKTQFSESGTGYRVQNYTDLHQRVARNNILVYLGASSDTADGYLTRRPSPFFSSFFSPPLLLLLSRPPNLLNTILRPINDESVVGFHLTTVR